jgi:hypothetical protein
VIENRGAVIENRGSKSFSLSAFPLAMNRDDRRELSGNDGRECQAAEQHVHIALP